MRESNETALIVKITKSLFQKLYRSNLSSTNSFSIVGGGTEP